MIYSLSSPQAQSIFREVNDYIGEENLVHFIEAFVALLDFIGLGFTHAEVNTTGRPSYNPADL